MSAVQVQTTRAKGPNLERYDVRAIAWSTGNVALCVDQRGFGLHLTLAPDEARALAAVLIGIADRAETVGAALAEAGAS